MHVVCVCRFGISFTNILESIDSKLIYVCLINDYSLIADLHMFVYGRAEYNVFMSMTWKSNHVYFRLRLVNSLNKRDFTIDRQSFFIRIAPLHGWKSLYFIMIGWNPWIKKMVNNLSCGGGLKDIFLYFIIQRNSQ